MVACAALAVFSGAAFSLTGMLIATGHFAICAFFAAATLRFGGGRRFLCENSSGHGEGKSAQKIFDVHDLTPMVG